MSADDLLDKLVYIATNPVKDGLVEKVHHWPGPNLQAEIYRGANETERLLQRKPDFAWFPSPRYAVDS